MDDIHLSEWTDIKIRYESLYAVTKKDFYRVRAEACERLINNENEALPNIQHFK